jgi:hypothetical protein
MLRMLEVVHAVAKFFVFSRHNVVGDSTGVKDEEMKVCSEYGKLCSKSENQVNDASDERRSPKLVGDEDHVGQLSQESKSSPGEETCDPRKLEALVSRGVEEKITTTKVKAESDEDGTRTTTSLDRVQTPSKRCSNRGRKALRSPRTQKKHEKEPLSPIPPVDVSTFPKNQRWSYDETTRVVHGDFTNTNTLDREDELFLLQMMERDDITVITDGFAKHLDPTLWTFQFIQDLVGEDVCHQFRVFQRRLLSPSDEKMGGKAPNEKPKLYESFEEKGESCSLRMKDYIRYIHQRVEQLHCIERRRNEMGISTLYFEEESQYRNSEKEVFAYELDDQAELNCIDTVLYLIDYDIGKLLPPLYQNFMKNFLAPNLLPGGKYCWMHEVSKLIM